MVPLYAARIEDLGPGDFVRVECIACSHDELIPTPSLIDGLRLPPTTRALPKRRIAWVYPSETSTPHLLFPLDLVRQHPRWSASLTSLSPH
jgi:hypothetical protein